MATANKEMGLSTPLHPHQDFSPDEMIPKKRKRISLSRKVRKPTMTDESFAEKENVDTTSEPELPVQEQDSQLTHEEPVKKKPCLSLSKKRKSWFLLKDFKASLTRMYGLPPEELFLRIRQETIDGRLTISLNG